MGEISAEGAPDNPGRSGQLVPVAGTTGALPGPSIGFLDRLRRRWERSQSLICVGLDPEYDRLPLTVRGNTGWLARRQRPNTLIEGALLAFNQAIIDATADLVCAYKPNSAFYEQYGYAGMRALTRTIAYIHARYPDVIVLLDAKRGDMGNTSRAYARAAFQTLNADAITLHSYLGHEGLAPFLEYADRGQFILCRTSNPGSDEIQGLLLRPASDAHTPTQTATGRIEPLYLHVARMVAHKWNTLGNCGL
ncbi:MAG TPA: orotidine-5'-phosphate decarboxylase, partial [Ktedonobacterales bacterium]|nr:orotidine-5'-phosphate decarboxylase [Ktedonobacterales bacterium]